MAGKMLCGTSGSAWHRPQQSKQRSRPLQAFASPYKVLQISEDADPGQIKRAYRKLALKHHPDISDLPSAEQDFVRIQEAYEMLTKRKEALNTHAASPGEGWNFHDWYWDFMSSSRWNSQWKKHGQAGPSPFAATPSHRNQWQAQLGKLKQKAAFRRAKQQAEQHAQPSETQPRSAGKSANRSDGVDNVHQESHQQAGQQQQTSTGGAVDDSADSDKFMQQAQSRSDQQNIGTISAPSPCSEQLPQHERSSTTQQECDTVSCQETTDADHSVKGAHQKKYSDTLNELRSSHSEQADASQCLHHEGTGSDCMEPVHKAGNGSAHQPVWDASIGAVHDTTNGHNTEESADAANGPGSYSYASEDSSHTATEKVQSQLLGLRRRAARKAAA